MKGEESNFRMAVDLRTLKGEEGLCGAQAERTKPRFTGGRTEESCRNVLVTSVVDYITANLSIIEEEVVIINHGSN